MCGVAARTCDQVILIRARHDAARICMLSSLNRDLYMRFGLLIKKSCTIATLFKYLIIGNSHGIHLWRNGSILATAYQDSLYS